MSGILSFFLYGSDKRGKFVVENKLHDAIITFIKFPNAGVNRYGLEALGNLVACKKDVSRVITSRYDYFKAVMD